MLHGLEHGADPSRESQDRGHQKDEKEGTSCLVAVLVANLATTELVVKLALSPAVNEIVGRRHRRDLLFHFLPDTFRGSLDKFLKFTDAGEQLGFTRDALLLFAEESHLLEEEYDQSSSSNHDYGQVVGQPRTEVG